MTQSTLPYRLPLSAGATQSINVAHVAPEGDVSINPVPTAFQKAFLSSKARHVAAQISRSINARPERYVEILGSLGALLTKSDPVPGGVGYGTFYSKQFQFGFTTGTEIVWSAVCPDAPGGNVQSILYMTATNRAARGVEALACYDPGAPLAFRVYDWSVPQSSPGDPDSRWVFNLSGDGLLPYLATITIGGQSRRCLPIYNSTVQTGDEVWTNSVLLHSPQNGWELKYSRSYSANLADQQTPGFGDWGPIVETFQPLFNNTNALGALDVHLRAKLGSTWSGWAPLSATDSIISNDNVGFHQALLNANFDWLVES